MRINSINLYNAQTINRKTDQQNRFHFNNLNFMGTPIVEKTTERIYTLYADRMPITVKNYLLGNADRLKYTPIQAQRKAFEYLELAENIQDVKDIFPEETKNGLFKNLKNILDTKASVGLLSIYREFKELYPQGILKSGEDFSVYLLKKILLEIKTYDDINKDLKNDLIDDVRNEYERQTYKRRILLAEKQNSNSIKSLDSKQPPKFEYVQTSTLNALGIKRPDSDYENSLRQTDEEYNKEFRKNCSQGQINRWSTVSEEERFEKTAHLRDKETLNVELTKNRVNIWQNLSQEEKNELITKIKDRQQTFRFALFDTWNNSLELLRELSKFLTAKQILKPVDVLFKDDEFREFQSKIMKEFWKNHRELAIEFGKTLSDAISRVEKSIQEGTFEELKQKIMSERDERIKILDSEKLSKEQKIKEKVPAKTEKENATVQNYKETFINVYNDYLNKDRILPISYMEEVINIILEDLPENIVTKMTEECKTGKINIENWTKIILTEVSKKNYKRLVKIQRALDASIARELYRNSHNPEFFALEHADILNTYIHKMHENIPVNQYPSISRIYEFYEKYKNDLTEKQLNNIVKRYFTYKTDKEGELIADYIRPYGEAALILFSDNKEFPDDVKIRFNEKFLRQMPDEIKSICRPVFSSPEEIIAEPFIKQIKDAIKERFDFMPADFLHAYTNEVVYTIHLYNFVHKGSENNIYSIKSFMENVCQRNSNSDNRNMYIKIPKLPLQKENITKILAGEQALADELFRVTENESVYKLEVEELMNLFELFTISRYDDIDILDKDGNVEYKAKMRPSKYYLNQNYKECLNELNERASDIFDEEHNIKDEEALLYALNPIEGNEKRDEYIRKRIKVYIEEPDTEPIDFSIV